MAKSVQGKTHPSEIPACVLERTKFLMKEVPWNHQAASTPFSSGPRPSHLRDSELTTSLMPQTPKCLPWFAKIYIYPSFMSHFIHISLHSCFVRLRGIGRRRRHCYCPWEVHHFTGRKSHPREKFIKCVVGGYSKKGRLAKDNSAGNVSQSQWALGTGNNSLRTDAAIPRGRHKYLGLTSIEHFSKLTC